MSWILFSERNSAVPDLYESNTLWSCHGTFVLGKIGGSKNEIGTVATSFDEKLGELFFHLGSFPGGMEDKAFIALLKDFDKINSDTIFNVEICDCDPNFEKTKVLSCGNARIERTSSSNVI